MDGRITGLSPGSTVTHGRDEMRNFDGEVIFQHVWYF